MPFYLPAHSLGLVSDELCRAGSSFAPNSACWLRTACAQSSKDVAGGALRAVWFVWALRPQPGQALLDVSGVLTDRLNAPRTFVLCRVSVQASRWKKHSAGGTKYRQLSTLQGERCLMRCD